MIQMIHNVLFSHANLTQQISKSQLLTCTDPQIRALVVVGSLRENYSLWKGWILPRGLPLPHACSSCWAAGVRVWRITVVHPRGPSANFNQLHQSQPLSQILHFTFYISLFNTNNKNNTGAGGRWRVSSKFNRVQWRNTKETGQCPWALQGFNLGPPSFFKTSSMKF